MRKIINIGAAMLLSASNCSNKTYMQGVNCSVINNVIKYLKESEKELKSKNIAVFDSTDALPFANFRHEIQIHFPSITSQIIDSLDYNAIPQKINCENKESNPKLKIVFSNIYKNLVICEWFMQKVSKT